MKRRILFVDDEPNLLRGLQRMLRSMRHEWDMEFVGSGSQALARIQEQEFDVVVSDVRMPEMDGIELLKAIRIRAPKTVRILLSGQADKENLLHSIGPAHQFLAKPCDAELLKTCVSRCCALNATIFSEQVKALVSRIECLPVLPSLYSQLVDELESEDPSLDYIGHLIEADPAMTAKILNIVNSAFFGLPQNIASANQATAYLGLDVIKDLVLMVKLFEHYQTKSLSGMNLDNLWRHSLIVADLAKRIMIQEGASERQWRYAFTGGMLHDLGMLIFAAEVPGQYQQIIEQEKAGKGSIYDLELETFGCTHAAIGAYLLGIWGLPLSLVETVAYHHRPADSSIAAFHPLIAVHVAHTLTQPSFRGPHEQPTEIDEEFIASIGFEDRLPVWRELNQTEALQE